MAFMKKHPFLQVDYHSTVKLSDSDKKQLAKWLNYASEALEYLFQEGVLPKAKFKSVKTVQVSLMICGDARIRELNREHRHKDKVTDVLSFPAHEDLRKASYKMPELFLGDLAICHQQTKRQAKEFKIGYWDEFIHLMIHGMIHLMGYDHEVSRVEEKLMEKWEKIGLDKISEIKKGAR